MFRRIELISQDTEVETPDGQVISLPAMKTGLMGFVQHDEIIDAWADKIQAPQVTFPSNARFYFTEKGWDEVGRQVVAACQRCGQQYRVLKVKENRLNVVFRDEYQVAGQPRRPGRKQGRRRR